jgi:hypothetical protein
MKQPTSGGVPVTITSPGTGNMVKYLLILAINTSSENIISFVVPFCFSTPLTKQLKFNLLINKEGKFILKEKC